MESGSERTRASNIIWNAAGTYDFVPDVGAYDTSGRADLYLNYIIGAVHRYYDYPRIRAYLDGLTTRAGETEFEDLLWTGLENCAYLRGRAERPVLDSLRRGYAEDFLRRCASGPAENGEEYVLDEVKEAHFRRALGREPDVKGLAAGLLADLEFDADIDTDGILARMEKIMRDYFRPGMLPPRRKKRRGVRFFLRLPNGSAPDYSMGLDRDRPAKSAPAIRRFLFSLRGERSVQHFIERRYGAPMLTGEGAGVLQRQLCTGKHAACRLHLTRGDAAPGGEKDVPALRQRKKNEDYYKANLLRCRSAAARLTEILKNAMLLNLEPDSARAESGMLDAARIWRSPALGDNKVFTKKIRDEAGDLSVDLLLDASASQVDRQELIASEAYIIAESLTRCRVPVRVLSYCSEKGYTVLNLFRDYDEANRNDRIFGYFASGCNRDGLAIRAAVELMKSTRWEHKLLVVLTDGLPNDAQGVPVGRFRAEEYLGETGVNDTALEVRRGWQAGISILCVFTGRDAAIPDAKRIYGHNLAYIKSQNRFADIVGVMLQNELRNF